MKRKKQYQKTTTGPSTMFWCPNCRFKFQNVKKKVKKIRTTKQEMFHTLGKFRESGDSVERLCESCKEEKDNG